MLPKEKARELVDRYLNLFPHQYLDLDEAKQCALIAVDELVETVSMCIPYLHESTYYEYWLEVKKEIIKL